MSDLILSTAVFPPIEYFVWMMKAQTVFIEAYENYSKQSYRNRYRILTANGVQVLSIPVEHRKGKPIPIDKVEISYKTPWQRTHWRTIESAYSKSPYFLFYSDELHDFFKYQQPSLFDFNRKILQLIMQLLKITVSWELTSSYQKSYSHSCDLRFELHPKKTSPLEVMGIRFPEYIQVFSTKYAFIPNLSILDLLFCVGPDSSDYLRRLASNISEF